MLKLPFCQSSIGQRPDSKPNQHSQKRHQRRAQARRVLFESLEDRRLLAGDLEIQLRVLADSAVERLDATFGNGGIVATPQLVPSVADQAVETLPDGKMLLGNIARFETRLTRLNPDGSIDPTYGSDGSVAHATDIDEIAATFQVDGKFVVAGSGFRDNQTAAVVARFNTDGSVDSSFGDGGQAVFPLDQVATETFGIATQSDGRIYVAGTSWQQGITAHAFVLRLNNDGTLDDTFGDQGVALSQQPDRSASGITLQPDGKVVVVGSNFETGGMWIERLNEDGTPDQSFGADGEVTSDLIAPAYHAVVQPDGKIVAAGWDFNSDVFVTRLNSDGTLDESFQGGGLVLDFFGEEDRLQAMTVQADGKLVLSGSAMDTATAGYQMGFLVRLRNDGSFDPSFGIDGKEIIDLPGSWDSIDGLEVQPDGRLRMMGKSYDSAHFIDRLYVIQHGNHFTAEAGQSLSFEVAISDPSGGVGHSVAWTIHNQLGDVVASSANSRLAWQPMASGDFEGNVRVANSSGNETDATFSISVAPPPGNTAPFDLQVNVDQPVIDEGGEVELSGSFADLNPDDLHIVTINWGDGSSEQFALTAGDRSFGGRTHIYDESFGTSFEYQATVTVEDASGTSTSNHVAITVNNAPPTVDVLLPAGPLFEGQAVSLELAVQDPSPRDASELSIQWQLMKNHLLIADGVGVELSFVPDDDGIYTLRVNARDPDGGMTEVDFELPVLNALPEPTIVGMPASLFEMEQATLTAAITDRGPLDTAAGFDLSWSVTKNGSTFGSPSSDPAFNFLPNDNGTYVISLSATDRNGGTKSVSATIDVANRAPTADAGGPITVVPGQQVLLDGLGDDVAGANDPLTFEWDFDYDGVSFQAEAIGRSQLYTDATASVPGERTIALRVSDDDGGSSIAAVPVTVTPYATTPAIALASAADPALNIAQVGSTSARSLSSDGRYVVFTSIGRDLVEGDTNDRHDVFVLDRQEETTIRVSTSSDGAQANGDSFEPAISGDGRYVVFQSSATNLVAGDTNQEIDIFRKDLQTGQTIRVNLRGTSTQANEWSRTPTISDDGQRVAFTSRASNLVTGDTNNLDDVFVRDIVAQTTTRVSVAGSNTQANGFSDYPVISGDGNHVVFRSWSSNLVAGDTNQQHDIFLRDLVDRRTIRVSVGGTSTQANSSSDSPTISRNGRYAAFLSNATNLVSGDTNAQRDVFVRDILQNTTVRASVRGSSTQANGYSSYPAISGDGRYVTFSSTATNLLSSSDTNNATDVFIRDLQSRVTTRVSTTSSGGQSTGSSGSPSISDNGIVVSFASFDSNLANLDNNANYDVFVKNTTTGIIELASKANISPPSDNSAAGSSRSAVGHTVSGDGRYVVFDSYARNLAAGANGQSQIYLRDTQTGETKIVSTNSQGQAANGWSSHASISTNGRYITFSSQATNLVPGDTNGQMDVFVKDLQTGSIVRANTSTQNVQAAAHAYQSSISDDGRFVVFTSAAANLVSGDTNAREDVFLKDLVTGALTRVSTHSNGGQANQQSWEPRISMDGNWVVFSSNATNLVSGDTNGRSDVFLKNRQTGATTRISTSSSGAQGNSDSRAGSLSADGRYIIFHSSATNLVSGDTNQAFDVFVKDRLTGQTTRISTSSTGEQGNQGSFLYANSISADGRFIAYFSSATNFDSGFGTPGIFVKDRVTNQNVRFYPTSDQPFPNRSMYGVSLSADGRHVAFSSDASNLIGGDYNNTYDVFVTSLSIPGIVLDAADDAEAQRWMAAINRLPSQLVPTTIELNLAPGEYSDLIANLAANIRLVIRGSGAGETTVIGNSPALEVLAGDVLVENLTLTTATESATVILQGGNLALRATHVEESLAFDSAAVANLGGEIDLGSVLDPGGNQFALRGSGDLIQQVDQKLVTAIGNSFFSGNTPLTNGFDIQQHMASGSVDGGGLVTFVPNTLFATTSEQLQAAVAAVLPGGTVQIASGIDTSLAVGDKPITVAFENGPILTLTHDGDQLALVIEGTDGPDIFNLSEIGESDVLVTIPGLGQVSFQAQAGVTVLAGDGNDLITSEISHALLVDGGEGNDSITGGSGAMTIVASPGEDVVIPGSGSTATVESLPPDSHEDRYQIASGSILTVASDGVLGNDVPKLEGQQLFAELVLDVENGELELQADGSFTYTPDPNFIGSDRFTYRASGANTSPSNETLVIIQVSEPPTIIVDQATIESTQGEPAINGGTFVSLVTDGDLIITASSGEVSQSPGAEGTWSWTADSTLPPGDHIIQVTATDSAGGVATASFAWQLNNATPEFEGDLDPIEVFEGDIASVTFTVSDLGATDVLSVAASVGTVAQSEDDPSEWTWSFQAQGGPGESQDVVLTVSDPYGDSTSTTFPLSVRNLNPAIEAISVSAAGSLAAPFPVALTAQFSDAGLLDRHHAEIAWGDGIVTVIGQQDSAIDQTARTIDVSHEYAAPGEYEITLTVFDSEGGVANQSQLVAIEGISLVDGFLSIPGTDSRDVIRVRRQGKDLIVSRNDANAGESDSNLLRDLFFLLGFNKSGSSVRIRASSVQAIQVASGAGDDTVVIDKNITVPVFLEGGDGNDWLQGGDGPTTVRDTAGNNRIITGAGDDDIQTGAGDDFVSSGRGRDMIDAGSGNNVVLAFGGHDQVVSGSGDDLIVTDGGNDSIDAGDGNNVVHAGQGDNQIVTGSGIDLVYAGNGDDHISTGDGDDRIWSGGGRDVIEGGGGNDVIEAGNGDDLVFGGDGDDVLDGGNGDDILVGGDGQDWLLGRTGRDFLIGGIGADRLEGDQGEDLLIAGFTSFDNNYPALLSLRNEWTGKNSAADRAKRIRHGSFGDRSVWLKSNAGAQQTVFEDGDVDILAGDQGKDWFFANLVADTGGPLDTLLDTGELLDDADQD